MSSATSTEKGTAASSLQPWQFFVLAGFAAATAGVFLSRGTSPANIVFISFIIGGAAIAGAAVYRMLAPLATSEAAESIELVGGRIRAGLEREKLLVLRSIKELEFDRAMNKISPQDYDDMVARLRMRAVRLIRQLDAGGSGYRELIERELASRLGRRAERTEGPTTAPADADADAETSTDAEAFLDAEGSMAVAGREPACASCGTMNEADARFCKACGVKLAALLLLLGTLLAPALALAQPDLRMMAGIPRPDGTLADGTITVRVVRRTLADNVTGLPVELIGGGVETAETAETDGNGRATFRAPAPGTIVRAATVVDGERLESQEFPAPDRGGVAVMLVAGLGDAPAQQPAQPGTVSIGGNSRFVVDLADDRLEMYYLLEIVNPSATPVAPLEPIIFDLPTGAGGAGALNESSPQVVVRGDRVTVTSPVPPGVTPVQIGFVLPYSGGEVTIEQRLPAALGTVNVVMRKVGDMSLASAQLPAQQESAIQGERYVMAAGPALGAGDTLRFTLRGLPHHSTVPRTTAVTLATLIVIVGLWAGWGRRDRAADIARSRQLESRREKAYAELIKLEEGRRAGRVDAARHASRRSALVEQLERIYAELDRPEGPPAGRPAVQRSDGATAGARASAG
jgi:hypothetical protein